MCGSPAASPPEEDPTQQPTKQRGVYCCCCCWAGSARGRRSTFPVGLLLLLGGVRSSSARHLRPAHPEGLLVLGGVRSSAARHLRAAYPASQRGVLLLGGVSMHHAAAEAVTSSDAASAARAIAAQRHKPMSRTARGGEGRSCSPRRQCLLRFGI